MATSSKKKPSQLDLKGQPNPRQIEFFLCTNGRHIAYGGSRGGG